MAEKLSGFFNLGFGISDLGFVSLNIYDTEGKEVITMVNKIKPDWYNLIKFYTKTDSYNENIKCLYTSIFNHFSTIYRKCQGFL